MATHGTFSGNPKTEWLVNARGTDRDMRLLEDFSFLDPGSRKWSAPKGAVINGASIPRELWSSVGSPYTDDYRRASVVHDVACNTPGVTRKEADVMFYHACRAGGCGPLQARILYAGVRLGAWASSNLAVGALNEKPLLFRTAAAPRTGEKLMKRKLTKISRDMEALPEEASIEDMDAVIQKHLEA